MAKIKYKQSRTFSDVNSILNELHGKLVEMKSVEKLEEFWKQLDDDMSEYDEALETTFVTDISKAYRNNNDYDSKTINGIIAGHFYHQYMFQTGNLFVKEAKLRFGNLFAKESDATNDDLQPIKSTFDIMLKLLGSVSTDKLEPALRWVANNSIYLRENGCSLELKLHAIQFMKILQKGDLNDALKYARNRLEPLKDYGIAKEKLIASVLSIDQPDEWPYAELLPLHGNERRKLQEELMQQYCNVVGQSLKGYLRVSVAAGFNYLPHLLKVAEDMAPRKQEWETMKQCPEAFDLEKEFMFHSSFICGHCSKEVTPENPLKRLPCGHAMCSDCLESKLNVETSELSCHICLRKTTADRCKEIYISFPPCKIRGEEL